jgi:hypothetical protein
VEKYVEVKNRGQEEEESCMYCLRLEVESVERRRWAIGNVEK